MIVPLGLVATFRLTGLFAEPFVIAKSITLETIEWAIQKPNGYTHIDTQLLGNYSDTSEISANFILVLGDYHEDDPGRWDNDHLSMMAKMNVTLVPKEAHIKNVYIVFQNDTSISDLVLFDVLFEYENLNPTSYASGWVHGVNRAYIILNAVNDPASASFLAETDWTFRTPDDFTHHLDVAFEITYYNGTTYKKITQPFQLNVLA
jgi:hypothetical protein